MFILGVPDWPDLAVELLLAGIDDPEVAELAGLPAGVSGWDTDCASVDPGFETDLETLPPLQLPDGLIQVLARRLRSTLPLVQPPRGHSTTAR
jgi:hypothetical protein